MAENPSNGIGIADLPNQRHRIVTKNGADFTIMVVGESGLGKTTFINTLFTTTVTAYKNPNKRHAKQLAKTIDINITKADIEERMFNVRLNIVDTPGFGDYVNNKDNWLSIVEFIDNQYELYMRQEQQPIRKSKIDMRVHACLYFLRPTGHSLKQLDIEVMKQLGSRVNLIPVIGKADTLSVDDLIKFKRRIRDVIDEQGIQVYSCPIESDDESTTRRNQDIMNALPFAVIGSDQDVTTKDGRKVKGRSYPWGVAEVENEAHCDFIKLRNLLIRTHMLDLVTSTEEVHYDNYRAKHLENGEINTMKSSQLANKFKDEEEALRRKFTEQVKVEENRFRQWEARLIAERDRLNRDLEAEHTYIKELEMELDTIATQKYRR